MALTQISTEGIKNGTITNADIGSSAAIAGTKISPDFGSQNITTTGVTTLTHATTHPLFIHADTDYKGILLNGTNTPSVNFARQASTTTEWRIGIDPINGNRFCVGVGEGTSNKFIIDSSTGMTIYNGLAVGGNITGTGDLTIDTNTLHVDSSTNRVGMGTTSPTTDFDVIRTNSSLTDVMLVKGNVGNGFIRFQDNDSSCNFTLGADAGSGTGDNSFVLYDRVNSAYRWSIDNSGNMKVWSGNVEVSTGKVGIGTSSPDAPLTIHNSSDPEIRFGYNASQDHRLAWDSSKVRLSADPDDANNGSALLLDVDGLTRLYINDSGDIGIGSTNPQRRLHVDGGNVTNTVQIDGTGGHELYSYHDSQGVGWATGSGGSFGELFYLNESSSEARIYAGGTDRLRLSATEVVVNEPGSNTDFRVEGDTKTHLLFVDAGNERVGINTASPDNLLHLETDDSTAYSTNETNTSNETNALLRLENTNGSDGSGVNNYVGIYFRVANGANSDSQLQYVRTGDNAGAFQFKARNASSSYPNLMTIKSDGKVGIGTTSPLTSLDIVDSSNGSLTEPLMIRNGGTGAGTDVGMIFFNGNGINSGAGALAKIKAIDMDNYDADLVFETALKSGFSTGGTSERMRITSAGNLLVGNAPNEDTTGNSGPKIITTGDITLDGDRKALVFRSSASSAHQMSGIQWWNEIGAGVQCAIHGIREAVNKAPGALAFYTSNDVDTSANNGEGDITEAMRIDSNQRILLGTPPSEDTTGNSGTKVISDGDITIDGDQKAFLFRSTASAAQIQSGVQWWNENGAGVMAKIHCIREAISKAPGALAFYTSDDVDTTNNNGEGNITERARITSIGEFRISPQGQSTNAVSTDFVHGIGATSLNTVQTNLARLVMQERSSHWISFKDGSGNHYGSIVRTGGGVSYGSNSDYRLKDNVANLTGGIALVKQLRPVTFNWNDLSGLSKTETHQGFIAHEVQALVSDAVDGEKDGMDIWGDCTDSEGNVTQTHVPESKKKDGETWTKKGEDVQDQQLDPGKLIPILTAALQELIAKVEILEAG